MNECLNCQAVLQQTKGKRKKEFCDSTCRSNYWQKQKRKSTVLVQDLTKPTHQIKPITTPPETTNISINPLPKETGCVLQFNAILSLAKKGTKKEDVEAAIKLNGKLNSRQVDMIRSKL